MIKIKGGFEKSRGIKRSTVDAMREIVYALVGYSLLSMLFPN